MIVLHRRVVYGLAPGLRSPGAASWCRRGASSIGARIWCRRARMAAAGADWCGAPRPAGGDGRAGRSASSVTVCGQSDQPVPRLKALTPSVDDPSGLSVPLAMEPPFSWGLAARRRGARSRARRPLIYPRARGSGGGLRERDQRERHRDPVAIRWLMWNGAARFWR